jgi:hypothetical protein
VPGFQFCIADFTTMAECTKERKKAMGFLLIFDPGFETWNIVGHNWRIRDYR